MTNDPDWASFSAEENIVHVYPINDERQHTLKGSTCRCNPTVKPEGNGTIVVHNAYDCREVIEEAEKIKNSVKV